LINKSSPGLKKQDWLLENLTHLQQALHFKTSRWMEMIQISRPSRRRCVDFGVLAGKAVKNIPR
jgi:hypothetical protein